MSSSNNCVTDLVDKSENENENKNENENGENGDEDKEEEADSGSKQPAPGTRCGQGWSRAGINVSMRFLQDKDGNIIDGHRAREIRIHARAIFVGFAMQGKQFTSWGDADAASRKVFYTEMRTRFEEFQFCDLDWKAEQIATDTFPGWKVTWAKKQKKRSSDQRNGYKRNRQGSESKEPELKCPKAVPEISSASSAPLPTEASATLQNAQVFLNFSSQRFLTVIIE